MKRLLRAGLLGIAVLVSSFLPGLLPVAQAYEDIRKDVLQSVLSGDATGDGTIIYIDRFDTLGVRVNLSGTALITFMGAVDGVTFDPLMCALVSATPTTSTTAAASGSYICPVAGMQAFKAQVTSWTSGTVGITSISTTGKSSGSMSAATFDASGNLNIVFRNCFSGESICIPTSPNSYMMINGATIRDIVGTTGVTTNTTSAIFTIPTGAKTPRAKVEGTGAVTATLKLYGSYDTSTTVANAVLLCTSTLSGTTKKAAPCDTGVQFTQDFPNYFIVSSNVTGTGATAEMLIGTGISASSASAGGAGDASAANQVIGNTSLGTIAGAVSGTGVNVSQINGVVPLMGAGTTGTGSARVTEATDSQLSAGVGATTDAASTFGASGSLSAKLRLLTNLTLDPCSSQAKTFIQINQTTGTQVNTGTAAMRSYVCEFSAMSATAQNVAIISGTGVICATASNPMYGGVTAATGFQFAANAGIGLGNGGATVMKTKTDADNICILQSGVGQVSGVLSIVNAIN